MSVLPVVFLPIAIKSAFFPILIHHETTLFPYFAHATGGWNSSNPSDWHANFSFRCSSACRLGVSCPLKVAIVGRSSSTWRRKTLLFSTMKAFKTSKFPIPLISNCIHEGAKCESRKIWVMVSPENPWNLGPVHAVCKTLKICLTAAFCWFLWHLRSVWHHLHSDKFVGRGRTEMFWMGHRGLPKK